MKKRNLYKLMVAFMLLMLINFNGQAQTTDKKVKKEQTVMIKIEMDEDGKTTTVDTIITYNTPDDVETILLNVEKSIHANKDEIKAITLVLNDEMNEIHSDIMAEMEENREDMKEAFRKLQEEIAALEIDTKAREKVDAAMEKLKDIDWEMHAYQLKDELVNAHNAVFVGGSSETIRVIVNEDDSSKVITKTIYIDSDSDSDDSEMNVWVNDEGEKMMIITTSSDNDDEDTMIIKNISDEHQDARMVFITDGKNKEGNTMMICTSNKKDIEKARAAGINIPENQKLDISDIIVEIENDDIEIALKTDETAKMKVVLYDKDFNKIKQLKTKKDDGNYKFGFNMKEMKEKAAYMLIEQNSKFELMSL